MLQGGDILITLTIAWMGTAHSFARAILRRRPRLPVDFAVRSAQRSPDGATRATSTGDGRLPAGCQLALGCSPGRYAVNHFAHEAGTKVPAGRCRRWVLFNDEGGGRVLAGVTVAPGRLDTREQTNSVL